MKQIRSVLVCDLKWHDIKKTEQYALSQAIKLLPEVPGVLYFGFPWTTLIDRLHSDRTEGSRLMAALSQAKSLLKKQNHVITVCQHIDLLKYQSLLAEACITHAFWPYTCEGMDCCSEHNDIKVLPFPLASAQLLDGFSSQTKEKQYLYSFVEHKKKESYLSQTCNLILNHMTGDKCGLVISRDQWEFGKYWGDNTNTSSGSQEGCFCICASVDYLEIMQESVFTLCPSSPGSNSERLWESLGCGSIPVIFDDTQFLPGSKALWDVATVSCSKRVEDISALSEHLKTIARDETLLERKRHAMRQLWMLYGPDYIIYDIHKLFLDLAKEKSEIKEQSILSYGRLFAMASVINMRKDIIKDDFDSFILGCNSRIISDPIGFKNRFEGNKEFRIAYEKAIGLCNRQYSDSMRRNLKFKGIVLN